ncbi:MAG: riboflavin biosynthesis protein RibF [Oscillospiraceae bacterium]|nr:riboflavin biosynthesis protein RibF [Oscillospiraceae bacterium]
MNNLKNSVKSSIALGLFDGIHLGHRAVLKQAAQSADAGQLRRIVFTFPAETAIRKHAGGFLYPSEVRDKMLTQDFGFSVNCEDFSKIRDLSGKEFIKQILCEKLQAGCVTCGENFRFGKNASCDSDDLLKFGRQAGFAVNIVKNLFFHHSNTLSSNCIISSTEIRRLLSSGDLETANQFLGDPYRIYGIVDHGAQLGRTIGFPTVNQIFRENQLIPAFGVYRSRTILPDGREFPSLTNIGKKPTVHYQGLPLAETYLRGFSGNLYGMELQVKLLKFIRPERKFDSIQALTAQMQKDLELI